MADHEGVLNQLMRALRRISGRRHHSQQYTQDRRHSDRRREPRYEIELDGDASTIFVRVNGYPHPLRDLSTRGFCIGVVPDQPLPEIGTEADVTMVVGSSLITARVRIANHRGEFVGCEIIDASVTWLTVVTRMLDPIRLGRALREIDPRFVKPDETGRKPRWYQGGAACDLFVWPAPTGGVDWAQLFFMGRVVEWAAGKGLRTGEVRIPPVSKHGYASAELYDLHDNADGEMIAVARRLIAAAELPAEVRDCFV